MYCSKLRTGEVEVYIFTGLQVSVLHTPVITYSARPGLPRQCVGHCQCQSSLNVGWTRSVWYSSRQPTTCVGVGVQGCVLQTQTALNIMTLLTHAHSMCASTQLVFLLLDLLVQTYVVRVAHVACSSCCSCCTTVGVTLSNTLRPFQLALKPLVQGRNTDTTQ